MDTKSKKFDRTWVTKTIAFLLAVVLTAYAAVNTVGTLWNLHETTEGISVYLEDVLRGVGEDDLTKTTAFANETRTVESLALQRYLFGDGSETAYANYLENGENAQATFVENYSRTVLQNCLGNSGNGSPVALQKYLRDGLITLEKIADHKKHFVQGDIYVSDYVAEEASSGDPDQVSLRVAEISRHDSLFADDPRVRSLAMELLRTHAVPEKEVTDAFHIATAAVYGMDILLTYNCRHMANLATLPKTASVIALAGYECPKILTPEKALEVQYV